ncbi:MAG: hypothetical protein ABS36_07075 [Acidobacteria bacterium SCN 69-37]|nr:MAG: hypothetical protein ABS36_07075 [Acidobacteria bacterium SCN 69-37]
MTRRSGWTWRTWTLALAVAVTGASGIGAQAPSPAADAPALAPIGEADIRTWLTTLSSDAMQGRAAFTEGYGLAAGYVSEQLRRIGATPLGIDGTYLQPVARTTYRVTRRSTITIETPGGTQTFTQGEHISLPALAGSAQQLEFTGVDFVGYGFPDPAESHAGRLVVLLPGMPSSPPSDGSPALASGAGRAEALVRAGAAAAVVLGAVPAVPATGGQEAGGGPRTAPPVSLTAVERVDRPRPPVVTADTTVFTLLLGGAPLPFEALRDAANRGEPLPSFPLPDVHVQIAIDHTYDVVSVAHTHNVVAMIPGRDPALRDRYVLFGAHLDHVGMATGGPAPGRVNVPVDRDPIWNGADDDGSGTSAVLAIAKALAEGPRPRRSTLFVWHTAEEEGLLGSRAMADDPVVPLAHIEAVFNIDMIGRNRDDDPGEADTVYVIGADRISTDLHNAVVLTNERASRPLTIDFHYNDPADPESFYTRSDHYSYASRGIPVAFFFTGTHRDYHANTDTVDKILFPKLVRIAQLIYEAGFDVAERPDGLRRDHRGPRAGRGFSGTIP